MIPSGHATIKHVCRGQWLPAVTSYILKAVGLGFADLIFLYRHPLDSLWSNWIFFRTLIRNRNMGTTIEQAYNSSTTCVPIWSRIFLN